MVALANETTTTEDSSTLAAFERYLRASPNVGKKSALMLPETVVCYMRDLRRYADWLAAGPASPLDRPTPELYRAFIAADAARSSGSTSLRRRVTLRRYAAWLAAERSISSDEAEALAQAIPARPEPRPRTLNLMAVQPEDIAAIYAQIDAELTAGDLRHASIRATLPLARMRSLLAITVATAIPQGELIALHVGDLKLGSGEVAIETPDGMRWPLDGTARAMLADYLPRVVALLRELCGRTLRATDPLWPGVDDASRPVHRQSYWCGLSPLIARAGVVAQFSQAALRGLALRRAFAGGATDRQIALRYRLNDYTVQRLRRQAAAENNLADCPTNA